MIGVLAGSIAGDNPYASQAQLVSLEDKSLDEKIDYLKSILDFLKNFIFTSIFAAF